MKIRSLLLGSLAAAGLATTGYAADLGVVTSLGRGKAVNWQGLTSGSSGIRHITRFPTDGLRTTIAGTVVRKLNISARTSRFGNSKT